MADQNWKIAATPRQRFVFLRAVLLDKETPKPKGSHAMRVRDRLRRALGLNQIVVAIGAAEATAVNGMPLIDAEKVTDVPAAFTVTAENADELEAVLKDVALTDGNTVTLASIIFGLLDRQACDPSIPDFDASAPDDWATPKNWRELAAAKTTPKPGEAVCPRCAFCFEPAES